MRSNVDNEFSDFCFHESHLWEIWQISGTQAVFYSLLVVAKIFLGEEAAASANFNGGFKGSWRLTRIST